MEAIPETEWIFPTSVTDSSAFGVPVLFMGPVFFFFYRENNHPGLGGKKNFSLIRICMMKKPQASERKLQKVFQCNISYASRLTN